MRKLRPRTESKQNWTKYPVHNDQKKSTKQNKKHLFTDALNDDISFYMEDSGLQQKAQTYIFWFLDSVFYTIIWLLLLNWNSCFKRASVMGLSLIRFLAGSISLTTNTIGLEKSGLYGQKMLTSLYIIRLPKLLRLGYLQSQENSPNAPIFKPLIFRLREEVFGQILFKIIHSLLLMECLGSSWEISTKLFHLLNTPLEYILDIKVECKTSNLRSCLVTL